MKTMNVVNRVGIGENCYAKEHNNCGLAGCECPCHYPLLVDRMSEEQAVLQLKNAEFARFFYHELLRLKKANRELRFEKNLLLEADGTTSIEDW